MDRPSKPKCMLVLLVIVTALINLNLLQRAAQQDAASAGYSPFFTNKKLCLSTTAPQMLRENRMINAFSPQVPSASSSLPASNASTIGTAVHALDDIRNSAVKNADAKLIVKQSKNKEIVDISLVTENSVRCSKNKRPAADNILRAEDVWQVHKYRNGIVFLYSAFYDDRPAAGFLPTVRLLAMLGEATEPRQINCHIWYDLIDEPYVRPAIMNETGMNRYVFDDKFFKEYTLTCPLSTDHPVPTYVSITSGKTSPCGEPVENVYTTYLPIYYVPRQKAPIEFGVCVANGYGASPVDEIVEWMELLRIYGVGEVNLYDTLFAPNMSEVFQYYAKDGFLTVHKLPHPLGILPTEKEQRAKIRNLRTVSLNDCMMRNMYRYTYIVVIDLDEMIVPRRHDTYSSMLTRVNQRLNLSEPNHSYSFYNAFYLFDFEPDTTQQLRTLRYRYRAKHSKQYYASKSFVSPLCCFNLFNHYCYTLLPGYAHLKPSIFAAAAIASSHHYRPCGKFYGLACEELIRQKTPDDVMLHVRDKLLERVKPVLDKLGHGLR